MAKKLSSVLGVDIGSQKIKICEIKTQGREPIVTALGMIDTPEGAVDHMGVYNSEAVGAALKQCIAQSGVTVNQTVVSIAGQGSVLVRTLEVPKMNPQELKDHMQWEINRNIPFAESTIVSDFKPLGGDDPNSPNMDVVMAIAPQSAIDAMITLVKKAGRQAVAIDVEPLSMARSIQTSYDDVLNGKTVCLVDIGHKTTSINIYQGEKLLMPRQVPIGGEMFTQEISRALGIDMAEAETLKCERCEIPESAGVAPADPFGNATQGFDYDPFGGDTIPAYAPAADPTQSYTPGGYDAPADPLAEPGDYAASDPFAAAPEPDPTPAITPVSTGLDPEAERLYNAIASILDEFLGEIRRSVDYYRSGGGEIHSVELCGGGAKLKGLAPFLSRALGVQCDAYDPLRRLNLNMRKVSPDFVDAHRHEFAVAVGNGLHIFFD